MNNRTLIIALTSYAGMGPYVITIVNSFHKDDNVWFVLLEDEQHYFSRNIKKEIFDKCRFICRSYSIKDKLKDLFFTDKSLQNEIELFVRDKEIQNIHFLTAESSLRGAIDKWLTRYNLFMTIHDLHPHEGHKAWYKMWRQRRIYGMLDTMREKIPSLITNSRPQYKELIKMYPTKKIFYHDFPTLITEKIKNGNLKIAELNGKKNYVLFFGRIEAYKGLQLLYNVWCDNASLHDNYTLVIAGSGDIYFSRRNNEKNIVFINRYIDDEEIANLYKNALCSVYPYISASQSGVLSLSCYFQVPMLTSDVSFFSFVGEEKIGMTFTNGSEKDLMEKLNNLLCSDTNDIKLKEKVFYSEHYDEIAIRESLLSIYNQEDNS